MGFWVSFSVLVLVALMAVGLYLYRQKGISFGDPDRTKAPDESADAKPMDAAPGSSTTPANATAGLQPGYVAFWGVTDSGVTISWSTNVPATTAVTYGKTQNFGEMTPVQTAMTVSHGVVLTGLSGGTDYYFAARSSDASGNVADSKAFHFKTLSHTGAAAPAATTVSNAGDPSAGHVPSIGFLASWGITKSGIIMSWSTDIPATTQLEYGKTKELGKFTPLQSELANSHGVTLTGLESGTTYYYVARSTSKDAKVGTSNVQTFATLADDHK